MPEYDQPEPGVVEITGELQIAPDLVVVPNRHLDLVPNIGVIGGTHSVLVVETGMGPRNAEKVLKFAAGYANGRRLYLTTTHFHPEHAFGAQVFAGEATYVANRAQADDLAAKGASYLEMFRGLGEWVARQLEGVTLVAPDLIFDGSYDLDLGGRVVHLRPTGRGHTKGDQVVTVPDAGVMFTGDLVETGQFAIFPWFPPYDTDVTGVGWIAVMQRLIGDSPLVVVPGHGDVGGPRLLADVRDYLAELRDETWRRRDALAPALREHGVTIAQYAVLAVLDEEPGLSNADLARRAFLTPQTMNQTLRGLEEKHWVTRRPHPGHGRILQAGLTRDGRAALRACHQAAEAIEDQMIARLSPEDLRQLEAALRACIDALS